MAHENSLKMIPSFDQHLVTGVATYSLELLKAVKDLDIVYVPIGLGSGICGMLAVRDALKLRTKIVGVVSTHAKSYAESFTSKVPVESPVNTKIADGMACRIPEKSALELIESSEIDVKQLITHTYPISDTQKAFDHAKTGDNAMKIIITK